jgi:1,4-dihydroxy-2-naphthoate octaprenyltransferase
MVPRRAKRPADRQRRRSQLNGSAQPGTAGLRPGLLQALNPPIYLISLLPGIGAWVLAAQAGSTGMHFLAPATLAVVLLQHAINLLNDAADWKLGADSEKYDSWVRFHHDSTGTATAHGWISFALGAVLGLAILVLAGKLWILAIATPMLILGYLYNSGPRPLSYTHLGEWVTGLCYGPGVFGCLWLLGEQPLNSAAVAGMVAFAALAMSLLLSHQPPQIETDRRAGKRSFAVRYGAQRTRQVSRLLFTLFLLSYGVALWMTADDGTVRSVYGVTALLALLWVARTAPKPVNILLPSALVLLVMLVGGVCLPPVGHQ